MILFLTQMYLQLQLHSRTYEYVVGINACSEIKILSWCFLSVVFLMCLLALEAILQSEKLAPVFVSFNKKWFKYAL